ncbi:MAG: ADOP family duplicated permease [Gemmatimonadota bacterium]
MSARHGRPPKLAERLLGWLLPRDLREPYLGDLAESFTARMAEKGARNAWLWYWRETMNAPVEITITRTRDGVGDAPSGDAFMTSFLLDARIALRSFLRRPGFTAVVVLTTAIGVGAATTIFSAANPILFSPLPYPHAERIVMVKQVDNGSAGDRLGYSTIMDLAARARSLEVVAEAGSWQGTMTGQGAPALMTGLRVSQRFFSVLGARPALGRDFLPEDDKQGAPRTVILSDAVWRSRFAADTSIIGKTATINDYPYLVIGVMPADFEGAVEPRAQLWRPLQYDVSLGQACRSCQHIKAIARVREGTSESTAAHEVDIIMRQLRDEHVSDYPHKVGGDIIALGDDITRGVRPAMLAVLGAVVLVLLIACVNVTNLLLGRVAERRAEISVRAALGASSARIVRQLLVESSLLASAGGALGVGIAYAGVRMLVRLAPESLPRVQAMQMSVPVLVLALVVTMMVGLGFGLLPALDAARGNVNDGMQSASRRTVGVSRRARSVLVIAEMALAVLVLAGSGLLLRSMHRLLDVRPGFEPSGLLSLQVQVVGQRFQNDTVTWRYFDDVLAAVRAIPGVREAALTSQLPLSSDYDEYGVHSERHPAAMPADDPSVHRYAVSVGYLEAMRIPVVQGRSLTEHDNGQSPPVALVSESFAKKFFKGENAIGQRVRTGAHDRGPWRTIVGITGDVHQVSLAGEVNDAVYLPESQWQNADGMMSLVIRTTGEPGALAGAVRKAVWSIDRNQPIMRVSSMSEIVASSAAERRFVLALFEAFAFMGIVLAALGMYGVLAASVTERVREIGLREALGATPWQIVSMIVRQGMVLATYGAVVGVILSVLGSRALAGQLFGVSCADPTTYAGAIALLMTVALVACAVPAVRAARVDPLESLRAD